MDNKRVTFCIAMAALVVAGLAVAQRPMPPSQYPGAPQNQYPGAAPPSYPGAPLNRPGNRYPPGPPAYPLNPDPRVNPYAPNMNQVNPYGPGALQQPLPGQYPGELFQHPDQVYAQRCGTGFFVGITRHPHRDCPRKCVTRRLKYSHVVDLRVSNRYACCCKPRSRDLNRGSVYQEPEDIFYQ